MDTGRYSYETSADGLCCYATKRDAARNAARAGARYVYSPTGRIVWSRPGHEPRPSKDAVNKIAATAFGAIVG